MKVEKVSLMEDGLGHSYYSVHDLDVVVSVTMSDDDTTRTISSICG